MGRAGHRLLVVLALWLAASAGLEWGPALAAPLGAGGDPSREVLVLLRLPSEHYRPDADYGDSYGDAMARAARRRIAASLAHHHGLTLIGDWPMPLVGVDCFIMSVPVDRTPDDEAVRLSRDPAVSWAEPVRLYRGESAPTAPGAPLFRAQPASREWRLTDLHQIATGRNVTVAIIDSMVERGHPDLLGQISVAANFVPDRPAPSEDHGTGVAGIIAAHGVGIVGVAPSARVMALRACWQSRAEASRGVDTYCDSLSLAQALHFAIEHQAEVINLSLGGPPDPLLSKLLDVAIARGITVVAAYDRRLADGGFPASHPGVVAVVDEPVTRSLPGVYSAPGRDVPTTQPGGRWFLVNGSSYAAAHVSGLFALMRERARSPRLLSLVLARGDQGAIDTCASLLRAVGPCDCACARPPDASGSKPPASARQ
jgi:hypothetical protein